MLSKRSLMYEMTCKVLAEDFVSKANRQLANGEYEKAILCVTSALELYPENIDYYFMRGKIHSLAFKININNVNYWGASSHDQLNFLNNKHLYPAINDFSVTLKSNPFHAEAYCQRGCLYALNQDLYESLSDLSEAYDLDKKIPDIKDIFIDQIKNKLDQNIHILTQFPDDKRIRLLLQCLELLKDNNANSLLRKKFKTYLLELIQPHREKMHLLFAGGIFDKQSNLYNVFPKELMHRIAYEFSKDTGIPAAYSFFHQRNNQIQNNKLQSEWNNFRPQNRLKI